MANKSKIEKKSHRSGSRKSLLPESIDRFEIRISGAGGQGIISTGMLLGEAIAIGDGKNVTQSQAYGPEARGGATRADIIISDDEIYFPECNKLDMLVAFTDVAYEKHSLSVKSNGLIIADESAVEITMGTAKTLKVPFIKSAKEKFGNPIVANIIALGFLSTYTGIVSKDSIMDAVKDKFEGSKYFDINIEALNFGFSLGKKYYKENPPAIS